MNPLSTKPGMLLPKHDAKHKPPRDAIREFLETIAFVVTLVLILKLFVVEAFVIPTGSMAETLLGIHKDVTCDQCGFQFPVNCHDEVDGDNPGKPKLATVGYCCPNCRNTARFSSPGPAPLSGDRILVHKVMGPDDRGYVVVFKFPKNPQVDQQPMNYIKRLVGFEKETIAVHGGDLFINKSFQYPPNELEPHSDAPLYPRPDDTNDLWSSRYTYSRSAKAIEKFNADLEKGFPSDAGGFELWRKNDTLVMSMRRIVNDNDHQPKDAKSSQYQRWNAKDQGWNTDNDNKVFTHQGNEIGWLKYRHLLRDQVTGQIQSTPSLITNYSGFNHYLTQPDSNDRGKDSNSFWVGDLMLECQLKISDPSASITLDLAKGQNRYQAEFVDGQVHLTRTGLGGKRLASRATPLTKSGTYAIRYANVDCRLRVWVNDKPIDFGTEADYPYEKPAQHDKDDYYQEGWSTQNDINEPVSIRATGNVEISKLKIWRDTFYVPTCDKGQNPMATATYYVQPGHYFCMGDNSTSSSDSRDWGVVPQRLMLGRAVFIFFPLNRFGFIK